MWVSRQIRRGGDGGRGGGRVEVEMVEEEGSILDTDLISPVTQADIPDSGITEISDFGPIKQF